MIMGRAKKGIGESNGGHVRITVSMALMVFVGFGVQVEVEGVKMVMGIAGPHSQGRHQNLNRELRVTHDSETSSELDRSRSVSQDVSRRSSRCKLGDWDLGAVTMEACKRARKWLSGV